MSFPFTMKRSSEEVPAEAAIPERRVELARRNPNWVEFEEAVLVSRGRLLVSCVRRSEGRAIRPRELPATGVWGQRSTPRASAKPARLYDLRSTFASNALAAGITVYELARIMGTSVSMIEAHYGALLDTAHDAILDRLDGVVGSFPNRDDGVAISEGVE